MEMPKPGPEHRALERFAGTWAGEEKIHPMPWAPAGGTARARVANVVAIDGFAIVQDYEQSRDDGVNFRGHGVVRWDAATSEYVFWWVDSSGMPPAEFRGAFAGDTLTLVSQGAMGHARAAWTFVGADRYEYRMDVSPDGSTWTPFLEGSYRRQG